MDRLWLSLLCARQSPPALPGGLARARCAGARLSSRTWRSDVLELWPLRAHEPAVGRTSAQKSEGQPVWSHHLSSCLCYHPVDHIRDAEAPLPAPSPGNPHAADLPRPVRTGEQLATQTAEALVEMLTHLLDRLAHPGRQRRDWKPRAGTPFSVVRRTVDAVRTTKEENMKTRLMILSASLLISGIAGGADAAGPSGRYYVTDESGFNRVWQFQGTTVTSFPTVPPGGLTAPLWSTATRTPCAR